MARKVVHLSSAHPHSDVRIFHKECRTLGEKGYDVAFVVPGDVAGKFDGVDVVSVFKITNRWSRLFFSTFCVFFKGLKLKGVVYHLHDPELIPVGLFLRLLGKKVVYDAHEDLPLQVLNKFWIPKPFRHLVATFAKVLVFSAGLFFSRIVAATPSIAETFPSRKTVLVQNFPVISQNGSPVVQSHADRPLDVAYIGGVSKIRGVTEMVEAMSSLSNENGRLVVLGKFESAALEKDVKGLTGWSRVEFLGWQRREEVENILKKSRAGLLVFHPMPNHIEAQPNKLFEYMAAGLPVIASDFPLWREIVERYKCGILVDPHQPDEIAEAVNWLFEHPEEAEKMGRRGMDAVHKQFNWKRESEKLIRMYEELLQ